MTQIEKITQDLHLIQFGMMKLNDVTQLLHTATGHDPLIKQMQDNQLDFINEFTLKINSLRRELLDNLDGDGMLLEEDYNYINAVEDLINAPRFDQ